MPRLSAVPGVGRKTAERIILELREKFAKGQPELGDGMRARGPAQTVVSDAVTALQNLGYSRVVAERAMRQVLHPTETRTDAGTQGIGPGCAALPRSGERRVTCECLHAAW